MKNITLIPEKLTENNFADFGEVVSIHNKESKKSIMALPANTLMLLYWIQMKRKAIQVSIFL